MELGQLTQRDLEVMLTLIYFLFNRRPQGQAEGRVCHFPTEPLGKNRILDLERALGIACHISSKMHIFFFYIWHL